MGAVNNSLTFRHDIILTDLSYHYEGFMPSWNVSTFDTWAYVISVAACNIRPLYRVCRAKNTCVWELRNIGLCVY